MYCEECNNKPANVHFTKIVNGNKISKHLCEECAKKYQQAWGVLQPQFSFSNLISSILGEGLAPLNNQRTTSLKCDKCGLTYSEFAQGGRVGCDRCYDAFSVYLESLLKRIHGNNRHTGKIPRRMGGDLRIKQEIKRARQKLEEAVLKEEFELAASLRDKIKALEENLPESN